MYQAHDIYDSASIYNGSVSQLNEDFATTSIQEGP